MFSTNPIFGISHAQEDKVCFLVCLLFTIFIIYQSQPLPLSQLKTKRKADDVEIVGDDDETDAFAMYYADVNKDRDKDPVYHPDLGLAIESLPEGITLDLLWQCVN